MKGLQENVGVKKLYSASSHVKGTYATTKNQIIHNKKEEEDT
jgi:hypothetical protein